MPKYKVTSDSADEDDLEIYAINLGEAAIRALEDLGWIISEDEED